MSENADLATLLTAFMDQAGYKDARLAAEINRRLGNEHFIHRSTIRNWREGTSKIVEDWRQLAAAATILQLDEAEANQLFQAASHPSIRQLWINVSEEDKTFLLHWTEPVPLQGIDESLQRIQTDVSEMLARIQSNEIGSTSQQETITWSVHPWQYETSGGVTSVAVSANGKHVVAGTLDKQVLGLEGNGKWQWKAKLGNQVWRINNSADGNTIVAGTGSTRFWDMTGRGLYCFAANGSLQWHKDMEASIWGLSLAFNGSTIAVGTNTKKVHVLDHKGHELWQHTIPGIGWYAWVWATDLSADGQIIIAGAADSSIRLFSRDGHLLRQHPTRGDVFTVSVSADGRIAAAADKKGYVYLLDQEGNLLWEQLVDEYIWQVKLSNDGKQLLVGAGKEEHHIYLFDQGGSQIRKRFVGGNASCLDLSIGGKIIGVGTYEGGIYVFDDRGNVLATAQAKEKIRDVAVAADGTTILAGSEDKIIYGFNLTINAKDGSPPKKWT